MNSRSKDKEATPDSHAIRDALGKAADLRAKAKAVEHDVTGAREIVEAKAKAAAANAKVVIAETKREIEQRVDDARIAAHTTKK